MISNVAAVAVEMSKKMENMNVESEMFVIFILVLLLLVVCVCVIFLLIFSIDFRDFIEAKLMYWFVCLISICLFEVIYTMNVNLLLYFYKYKMMDW